MKKIKILKIIFLVPISFKEVEFFRGAIIATAGRAHILFHNHKKEGFRYSYPLIQYKRIGDKPVLICINEGVDEMHHFFSNKQEGVMLGNRPYELKVDEINLSNHTLSVGKTANEYQLNNWLPLNQKNISKYNSLDSKIEQYEFLERILVGNILSMAKGLDWFIKDKVSVNIKDIKSKQVIKKSSKLLGLDIHFVSNIELPDYIGLGKNSSLGYGVLKKVIGK